MDLTKLATERRNPDTINIDELSTLEVVKKIHEADQSVASCITPALSEISKVAERVVQAFETGGRLIYIGAGTSGRLGVLDASECPPTYGTDPNLVVGLIAGGDYALQHAIEGAEDDSDLGKKDLQKINVTNKDVVVAIAASGRTPYCLGAMEYAKNQGAYTAAVVCSLNSPMESVADTSITVVTGPEVVTGSTRMKAGTAQKLVLNMISTTSMIKWGKVYSNLMVDVQPTNVKLKQRARNIIMEAAGVSEKEAEQALKVQNGNTKAAIFQLVTGVSPDEVNIHLEKYNGRLKEAIKNYMQK
ncbi:N-acetylmuramic acid 6-phosphate etherase [Fictibacillus phosphorivorans]|uniref:N-acetylmuramic acid 6-phosphate etherase n=1 Tax=Fictibacillus phosphorivorans TaxID=1221500 RepID=UPI00203ED613|nr:N-acetylmuramic acid 6-phosphate etherase [Fictibacillus phosphorivorans]MCM3718695.1 N-acetylmuramic acid 6-phosphate etherase [Fictibacillus phosphorivorans]MCM3776318.1 N-acetylmuramic acid 6-phosphate etherase [Fictibacillus phosphorivorans]